MQGLPLVTYTCDTSATHSQRAAREAECMETCKTCDGDYVIGRSWRICLHEHPSSDDDDSDERGSSDDSDDDEHFREIKEYCPDCDTGVNYACSGCKVADKLVLMDTCGMCGTLFCAECKSNCQQCCEHRDGSLDCMYNIAARCKCPVRLFFMNHYTINNTKKRVMTLHLEDDRVRSLLGKRFPDDVVRNYGYRSHFKPLFRQFLLCWQMSQSSAYGHDAVAIPYELMALVLQYAQPICFEYTGAVFEANPMVFRTRNMEFRGERYTADITLDVDGLCNGPFKLCWLPNDPIYRIEIDDYRKHALLVHQNYPDNKKRLVYIFGGRLVDNVARGPWSHLDIWNTTHVLNHLRFKLPPSVDLNILDSLSGPKKRGFSFTLL